jgi:uncharacterized BrkB/YihY/UPF0761 family membrane protein
VLCFGFAQPLTCRDLISRTIREFVADNGLGLAAQLAFYFFFALFPAILVGIALASFFPLENLLGQIVSILGGVVPADVVTIIQEQMRKISEGNHGGILTFGLVAALCSSSAALMGLIDALNHAYDIEERSGGRSRAPRWRRGAVARSAPRTPTRGGLVRPRTLLSGRRGSRCRGPGVALSSVDG